MGAAIDNPGSASLADTHTRVSFAMKSIAPPSDLSEPQTDERINRATRGHLSDVSAVLVVVLLLVRR
jgi:hypothetical protein